jgi:hypothetical protein
MVGGAPIGAGGWLRAGGFDELTWVTVSRFEVEQVLMIARDLPVVLARLLSAADLALRADSTLNGCPVAQFLEIPPALRADGSPRLDLFAFALVNAEDLARFSVGQVVLLEAA